MARRFRFLDRLGQGAFGEVHLAELTTDEDFSQTVAVKWLHAQYSNDPELAGRLRDEARLLGLLQHPNIVRVSGLTRIDGRLAVLMEPITGRDLTQAHVPPRATADIVASVADALDAAWETIPPGRSEPLRVVHRDIKPSNIMVTRHGLVKVMDFGVARATFESREAQTRSQQYGTARYMAPERWIDGIAEAPSDVFSLGITLVELASGAPVARPRLSREGFEADLAGPLESLAEWPELQSLAADMVAFSPDDRPSAAEVGRRAAELELPGPGLRAWAATIEPMTGAPDALTGTVVAEDTGADTFAIEPVAQTAPLTLARPAEPEVRPRNRAVFVGLFALVALGAVGVATTLMPTEPTADPVPTTRTEVPVVVPDPEPAPAPVPEPEPVQQPEPVAAPAPAPEPSEPPPRPEPRPVRPAPTPPAPVPDPEPEPEVRVTTIFEVDPGLSARVAGRELGAGRTAVDVPAGDVLPVEVRGPDGTFGCSILVGQVTEIWQIRTDRRCVKTG
ncbi:MAG: serine/threonine-protein kinase [Myxococcota bacterium]